MKKNDLIAEMNAIKARLAELEMQQQPKPHPAALVELVSYPDSIKRDGKGFTVVDPDLPSYEERMAKRAAEEKATAKAEWDRRTEGLPPGLWRDNSGLVRNSDGERVLIPQVQEREAKESVERINEFLDRKAKPRRKIYPGEA